MKYVTFATKADPNHPRLGFVSDEILYDLASTSRWAIEQRAYPDQPLPGSLLDLISAGPPAWDYARQLHSLVTEGDPQPFGNGGGLALAYNLEDVNLLPPLPRPLSLRDFYAFEAHVAAAHAIRGKEIPPEWYQFPVFYFSNPHAIFGPGDAIPYPASSQALDFELEVACVIGQPGRDIPAEVAGDHIFGYTILNDWSARDIQRAEMRVGLGPAKGKDFASSLGPWIITADELVDRESGRLGVYDLQMSARVNGEVRSRGNWKDIHFSFGELIARASQNVCLLPGEVIGSGTVGTGCLLELTEGRGPWLQAGDIVELEIERLGKLANRIGKDIGG
jgi:fumarylacetoacetate (FAA) hydrolase